MGGTGHVVLLGDSILDNAAYVGRGPDVVAQLRAELGGGWAATLLARDGDVTAGVARQLGGVPADATHLVVSAGGNDALGQSGVLGESARSVGEAVARLTGIREGFAQQYRAMVDGLAARRLPVALCTIYDARYPEPYGAIVRGALSLFNDVITRAAAARGMALVDLRLVCSEAADYANPIEPSVQGGAKIARAVAAFLRGETGRSSTVWR
jgi:hypothetical protein